MTRVELRAVAWPVVGGISAVAGLVGACGVTWPASGQALLLIAFALLAAAAAFLLDEPASAVVDVTPTGPARRTGVRALGLTVPLGVGMLLVVALALRAGRPSWGEVSLALGGSVLLGFAVACVARRRVGEPGAVAAGAVVVVLVGPGLFPPAARWVHTFPATGSAPGGLPVTVFWWLVGGVCAAARAASLAGPRWRRPVPSELG
jgi:hypothetical protein